MTFCLLRELCQFCIALLQHFFVRQKQEVSVSVSSYFKLPNILSSSSFPPKMRAETKERHKGSDPRTRLSIFFKLNCKFWSLRTHWRWPNPMGQKSMRLQKHGDKSKSSGMLKKQHTSLQTGCIAVQSLFPSSPCLPQPQQDTGKAESLGSTAWQHFYQQPYSSSKYYGMNSERPLQSPDSLLCKLPALITRSWVAGFGVYIRYLTLPLLPLAVHNRQTWDILKPAHASSFQKPSSLLRLASEE